MSRDDTPTPEQEEEADKIWRHEGEIRTRILALIMERDRKLLRLFKQLGESRERILALEQQLKAKDQ